MSRRQGLKVDGGEGGGGLGGGKVDVEVDVASSCRVQMHFSTFLDTGE